MSSRIPSLLSLAFLSITLLACAEAERTKGSVLPETLQNSSMMTSSEQQIELETAVLGAGCFWCVEAVFSELNGVVEVTSGYTGGSTRDPSYKEVCSGSTGHAEVAMIKFDPETISFTELLEVFWQTHDPTTKDRQGADVGTQYRSAIFFTNEEQQRIATELRSELDASGAFDRPIVTEITALGTFYPAEDYHQDYYALNGEQGYCQMVIRPKLEKFRKVFANKLKP
ncbi:MAG: peptide-methionine (S)-S-oxide reductase MsrA [Flavobacteriales bacterium]|nr:peptide-methionine (S)-S-oxide reductase MsrA [Flavobacteriales bacterium]